MGLAHRLAAQLARPRGWTGRLVGHAMDRANGRPTRLALDLLAPRAGERVLDIGCGTGLALAAIAGRADARLTGIDPSPLMVQVAQERLGAQADIRCASIECMDFPPASFDAVLMLNMLYFCPPGIDAMQQVHRVLRPGGRAVAYVTHRETMQGWSFAQAGLHRLYDQRELSDLFLEGGFAPGPICVQTCAITPRIKGLLAVAIR